MLTYVDFTLYVNHNTVKEIEKTPLGRSPVFCFLEHLYNTKLSESLVMRDRLRQGSPEE